MPLSAQAQAILDDLDMDSPRMGDVKKLAAQVKKDHILALELWATGGYAARLVAVLIMDKAELTQSSIEALADDMASHPAALRDRLSEWFMAHQLMKSKKTIALLETWCAHRSPTLRRLYWYYQGRLRWMGKIPVDNAPELLAILTETMGTEPPEVQWVMNFTAGWIGVYEPAHRDACVALGTKLGLYKGDPVSRGCTPNYLPEFIAIEVAKRA